MKQQVLVLSIIILAQLKKEPGIESTRSYIRAYFTSLIATSTILFIQEFAHRF